MRSPLIMNATYIPDDEKYSYSELMVLQSGAGYYIGTQFFNPEGYREPGSRDSVEYYPTHAQAQHALDTRSWTQRNHA